MMSESDCPSPQFNDHSRPPDDQRNLNSTDDIGTGEDLNDSGDDLAPREHNISTDAVHSDHGKHLMFFLFEKNNLL